MKESVKFLETIFSIILKLSVKRVRVIIIKCRQDLD